MAPSALVSAEPLPPICQPWRLVSSRQPAALREQAAMLATKVENKAPLQATEQSIVNQPAPARQSGRNCACRDGDPVKQVVRHLRPPPSFLAARQWIRWGREADVAVAIPGAGPMPFVCCFSPTTAQGPA